MDFVEEYSPLQTPKYKKIFLAVGVVAVCGVILAVTLSASSTGGGSPPSSVLQQSLAAVSEKPVVVPETATTRQVTNEQPVIKIRKQGRIRGTTLTSRKGRSYFAFYGVPYARPPVGKLRFQPPEEPRRWIGIRDGTKPGTQCIQKEKYAQENIASGSEDCLILNIYTPELPSPAEEAPEVKLPVLVYLHGGGVQGNGTRYGAKYIMDEPAVLVTVDWRMGLLGYFSTDTSNFPGNYGPKDQVLALKWVQKNINLFGGDPSRVLLFGNSKGSASVQSLLVSKMSEGLFHTAIMQSGNCIGRFGETINRTSELNELLAKETGCEEDMDDEKKFVRCLRKVPAGDFVTTLAHNSALRCAYPEPVSEDGDSSNTFMDDFVWNLMQKGQVRKVPLIVGDVSEESMSGIGNSFELLLHENETKELNENWNEMLPGIIGLSSDDVNHTVATRFREFYFGDKPISNDTRIELLQLSSDRFVHSQRTSAMVHQEKSAQPTYLYWLTKEPAKTYGLEYESDFPPPYGVSHADELQYLFLYDGYPEIGTDSPWFHFSETLVKIWVSFAATGKPNSPGEEWRPLNPADNGMKWYELGDELREIEPATTRMLLWDEYTSQLYAP